MFLFCNVNGVERNFNITYSSQLQIFDIKYSMNRLNALRILIIEHQCDAYLITDSNAHYTFYSLSGEDRRIDWITQCQAQCELALVTSNGKTICQVPPNSRLLAKAEIDENSWLIVDNIVEWLNQFDSDIGRIGYDPRLTPLFVIQLFTKLNSKRRYLYPISSTINLIAAISNNETTSGRHILTPIWSLDKLRFAGQSSAEKISELRQSYLNDDGKWYTFVTMAMNKIGWLLNLRANDMQCNPLFYSFMVISQDHLIVFTDNPYEMKNSSSLCKYDIRPYGDFFTFLSTLESSNVWLDERICMAVINALPASPTRISRSPIQQMKEIKNSVEINGFRECHYCDCAAVCRTFSWLVQSINNNMIVSELDVVNYLEQCQREMDYFIGIAFDTTSATGTNTALPRWTNAIVGSYQTR